MVDEDERVRLRVEAWKTAIQVQQHFNDIEMKLRGLALTVITAVLGAAGVLLRDGDEFELFGATIKVASALVLVAILAWFMFYMVDQMWYHQLLVGSVRHAESLEDELDKDVPGFGLTHAISKASPYRIALPTGKKKRAAGKSNEYLFHSRHKLQFFYYGLAALMVGMLYVSAAATIKPRATSGSTGTSTSTSTSTTSRPGPPPARTTSPPSSPVTPST